MATAKATVERPKPRLNNLDELFKLNEDDNSQPVRPTLVPASTETSLENQDTVFTTLPFSLMDDYPEHLFRLYTGQRKEDMTESIRVNGVLQPLILHAKTDGRYTILAGHNRKYCGIEAGLDKSPVIIKYNLTDAEAQMYVIETNLMQRSFNDLLPSEKAAILATYHSKMFSQGKRNDILAEIKRLENPHDISENSTSAENRKSSDTRETLAQEYGLKPHQVALYLRIHQLIEPLKIRFDNDEFPISAAADLSFLKETEQKNVNKCIELNEFKVDGNKTAALRGYSEKGKLNEDNVYLILNGELGQPPKKRRTPTFKIKPKVYSLYFSPGQKASEIEEVIEKVLALYFSHQNQNREQETTGQESQAAYLTDDDVDHDYDEEQAM